ncbi:MAG: response regulator transcription factor [Candidatus Obscuribacterales bacterium]|jgi:two-component system OmpR family response regulator
MTPALITSRNYQMAKILLIEDDELLAASVKKYLQNRGHEIEWVADGKEGLDRLRFYQYDLAILDWQLPSMDGPNVVKEYRNQGGVCPVLMLTGNSAVEQRITGLDSGADDYLTKPFSIEEVNARIQAILRRPANLFPSTLSLGNLEVDIARKVVKRDGIAIKLLPKEFALLEFLLRRADQFFDVNALLSHVWSSESEASEAAVWQVVKRLRQKLDDPQGESIIVNVKGMGYKIDKSRIQSREIT